MSIDHVTYQVPAGALDYEDEARDLKQFFGVLGMYEIDASGDVLEAGWKVRWFKSPLDNVAIHLVEGDFPYPLTLGLGHFCIKGNAVRFERARESRWVEHDSDSGRVWLKGPFEIRAEVRP